MEDIHHDAVLQTFSTWWRAQTAPTIDILRGTTLESIVSNTLTHSNTSSNSQTTTHKHTRTQVAQRWFAVHKLRST